MKHYDIYKYGLHYTGKSYGTKPNFVDVSILRDTGFSSLYQVDINTAKAIESTGSTKGFKGVVWSEKLWLDIDSYETAEWTECRLKEMGLSYVAYDSGGKGAHFGIMRDNLPSHLLPAMDKAYAKEFFPDADTSIYTSLHLFRLPGTVHEISGRKKVLISEHKAGILKVPALREDSYVGSEASFNGNNVSIFDCWRVMSNSTPTTVGNRHSQLVTLTYALKDDAKTDKKTAFWWIQEVNKLFEEPKAGEELWKLVSSIYG